MVRRIAEVWRGRASVLLFLLLGLAGFLSAEGGPATGLAAVAAAGALLLLCGLLGGAALGRGPAPGRIRTAIRDRERRTAFLPQRDPDAAGRPRPRAPGRPVRTATWPTRSPLPC